MSDMTTLLPHLRLQLNIKHPSLEECYIFGYECALSDVGEEENPYTETSQESEYWLEGWWAGFYGEKPLFKTTEKPEIQVFEEESHAANDQSYYFIGGFVNLKFIANVLKITGAIAATAVVGYQVFELVA